MMLAFFFPVLLMELATSLRWLGGFFRSLHPIGPRPEWNGGVGESSGWRELVPSYATPVTLAPRLPTL